MKYAIVTGVSSGIGKYIADEFTKKGIHVFGIDIKKTTNKKISFYQCDISDEKMVINTIKKIKKETSCIDYLINVAGIFCYRKRDYIKNITKDEWDKVINTNLTGTFLITKYAIPLLEKSKNGNIINLSSEQVNYPQVRSVPYVITKAGIEMFSKVLSMELLDSKIRVNTIALASVKTNFLRKYKKDKKVFDDMMDKTNKDMPFGIIQPEDVYNLVNYLIDDNNKITGQTIIMDSGIINKNMIKR
jgi:NAD(P)-dependent dehydrogenase (short-subunit alcohol dehydrogenase family)